VDNNKLMVYGILKRGYELDLERRGCKFLGECLLQGANLYGIGYLWPGDGGFAGVGLRLVEDPNRVAHGELFEIPEHLWKWLDHIEQNGFCYTRKLVKVDMETARGKTRLESERLLLEPVECWVYEHTYPGMKYTDANLIENGRF
jgi:gamma-glutamylcyclotransferase (GGCT)/AIG2-like uncharacterized protein YtfP